MRSRGLRLAAGALGLCFALSIAFAMPAPLGGGTALAAATTLTINSGTVTLSHASGDVEAAVDGQVLFAGDTIRTGPGSRATITYFEGSTVTIEAESALTVDVASTGRDGDTLIVMSQHLGRTWHVVTSLLTGSSRYEVKTPASTASVRGTVFEVRVSFDAGATTATVTTTEGLVVHSASDPRGADVVEVPVAAGATHKIVKGERPAPALRVVDRRPATAATAPARTGPSDGTKRASDAKATAKPRPAEAPKRTSRPTASPRPDDDERRRERGR